MAANHQWFGTASLRANLNKLLVQGLAGFGLLMLVLILSGRMPSNFAVIESASASDPMQKTNPAREKVVLSDPRQQKLASFLARRYRVSEDEVQIFVADAYSVGRDLGVDPLLILAVVSVESRFNPIAESSFGAKGLMQVVPRFHLDKFSAYGGADKVLEARTNMRVGSQILREYIRNAGSLEVALQMYAGALDDETAGYALKVITERDRLHQVLGSAFVASV